MWDKTKDVCVKTVMCGQKQMKTQFADQIQSEYNCYKLWGFDVFLDEDLKPWLLEVSIIQSTTATNCGGLMSSWMQILSLGC